MRREESEERRGERGERKEKRGECVACVSTTGTRVVEERLGILDFRTLELYIHV